MVGVIIDIVVLIALLVLVCFVLLDKTQIESAITFVFGVSTIVAIRWLNWKKT